MIDVRWTMTMKKENEEKTMNLHLCQILSDDENWLQTKLPLFDLSLLKAKSTKNEIDSCCPMSIDEDKDLLPLFFIVVCWSLASRFVSLPSSTTKKEEKVVDCWRLKKGRGKNHRLGRGWEWPFFKFWVGENYEIFKPEEKNVRKL